MTQKIINLGVVANDGSGDTFRQAMGKTNDNFTELYQLQTNYITEADSGQFIRANGEWLSLDSAGIVRDAVSDGALYARRDSSWIEIPSNLEAPDNSLPYARQSQAWVRTVREADSDGTMYVRRDGDWVVLPDIIPEALSDGTPYVRQNGNWVSLGGVTGISEAPNSGQVFARQNETWVDITTDLANVGIVEAPTDGFVYGRQSTSWTTVTSEAPNNGTRYVRRNLGWTPLTFPVNEAPVDGEPYARQDSAWIRTVEEADSDDIVYGRSNGAWTEVLTDAPIDSAHYLRYNGDWVVPPVIDPVDSGVYLRDSSVWVALDSSSLAKALMVTSVNVQGINDAPGDGTPYLRQDSAWINAIPEAPIDSSYYTRYNGQWALQVGFVEEAPVDSDIYARGAGTWINLGSGAAIPDAISMDTSVTTFIAGTPGRVYITNDATNRDIVLPDITTYEEGSTLQLIRVDSEVGLVNVHTSDASHSINGILAHVIASPGIRLEGIDPTPTLNATAPTNTVEFIRNGTVWRTLGYHVWGNT